MKAILSYCGHEIECTIDGASTAVVGWQGTHSRCYPEPIGKRWLSACDVPDLELFPPHYGVATCRFSAGLELAPLQWATSALSIPVRLGLLPKRFLSDNARALAWLSERLKPLGSTRGAMHVELVGRAADGTPLRRALFLCADNGRGNPTLENTPGAIAGPEIPCTPAVLLVQKLARRKLLGEACDALRPGAYPCISLFSWEEVMASMEGMAVWTVVKSE